MFRYRRGSKVSYEKQGYVYFTSRRYKFMPQEKQREILNLCVEAGGEYYQALFEYVTTEISEVAVTMKHYISKATLNRIARKYLECFPDYF